MNESDKIRALQADFKIPETFQFSLQNQLTILQLPFIQRKFNAFWLADQILAIPDVEELEISFSFPDRHLRVDIRFNYLDESKKLTWRFSHELLDSLYDFT